MKNLLIYIFLGFIQGITEPIPVSSSGHILIFKKIIEKFSSSPLNLDYETFATITNFGSFIAIFIFFRKEIFKLIKSFFTYLFKKDRSKENKLNYNYCWYIVVATIPAGVMGIIVSKLDLFKSLEKDIRIIGLMLVITALFLYIIKDFKGMKDKKDMKLKDAIEIGIFQMIALLPGISRSGSTIVGGMFSGLKREDAFNFSFMLYLPISVATMILGVKDLLEMSISSTLWVYYIIGAVISGIFTYIATIWFRNTVKNGKLMIFSMYCLIAGLLVMMFL
ncbi:MAG: undecaprenyl-diphosphate phosphatase [Tenericutes bacterium]|nr:undecaprenyl-diphosphate phosphatase [Mycoplasmatota bacterium]